jgi:hypothetical protein
MIGLALRRSRFIRMGDPHSGKGVNTAATPVPLGLAELGPVGAVQRMRSEPPALATIRAPRGGIPRKGG